MILYYRKNYKIWWFLKKQIWMSRLGRLSYFATGGEDGTAILRPNAPAGDSSGASAVSSAGPTSDSGDLRRESRRLSLTGAPPERPAPEGGPRLERRVQHGCGPRRRSDGACPQQGLRAAPAHRKVCCTSTSPLTFSLLFFVSFVLNFDGFNRTV